MPGSPFCSRYTCPAPAVGRRRHCRLPIDRRSCGRRRFWLGGTRRQARPQEGHSPFPASSATFQNLLQSSHHGNCATLHAHQARPKFVPRSGLPTLTMADPRPPTSYARADRTALTATKAPAAGGGTATTTLVVVALVAFVLTHGNPVSRAAPVPERGPRTLYEKNLYIPRRCCLSATPASSAAAKQLNAPIVAMAPAPDGRGYWLVGSDGSVLSFGDAHFYGSTGGKPRQAPIVGMAPAPDGQGYWLVGSDGNVLSFGDTHFYGSAGGNDPTEFAVVGMPPYPTAAGTGWSDLTAVCSVSVTRTFTAQRAASLATPRSSAWHRHPMATATGWSDLTAVCSVSVTRTSTAQRAASRSPAPIVGMAPTIDGRGYWLVGSDGDVISFGDAHFFGSAGSKALAEPVVALATHARGGRVLARGGRAPPDSSGQPVYPGSRGSAEPASWRGVGCRCRPAHWQPLYVPPGL